MSSIIVHFSRFGPYHIARIDALQNVVRPAGWKVIGLETGGEDETYAWSQETEKNSWERVTLFPGEAAESIDPKRMKQVIFEHLEQLKPDVMAIAGWGSHDARACLNWCRKNQTPALVMSETRAADGHRVWWKERVKSLLVRQFTGALVGGRSHREYLSGLGMAADRIEFGYNVVDNEFFREESERWREKDSALIVRPYLLASNRFIPRKNLLSLVSAFSDVCKNEEVDFDLCLLGDGEEKKALISRCSSLGLDVIEESPFDVDTNRCLSAEPCVFFPGFRQKEELPRFYAHAAGFIHPASEEPWGLVLNEAMACGLPILSGSNVGAAEELIEGESCGWTFDATQQKEIENALIRFVELSPDERSEMGAESRRVLDRKCPTRLFGEGLRKLLEVCC